VKRAEICIKARNNVMAGYWNKPDTAKIALTVGSSAVMSVGMRTANSLL
jgi:acyl-CoA synthetase (AMP-forming)/AMP-acid ligase II